MVREMIIDDSRLSMAVVNLRVAFFDAVTIYRPRETRRALASSSPQTHYRDDYGGDEYDDAFEIPLASRA